MDYSEEKVRQAEKYSALRMTQREMALLWGVTEQTVVEWKKVHAEFAEALERGLAMGIQSKSALIFNSKDIEDAKYYLKHAARDRWGDVQRIEQTIDMNTDGNFTFKTVGEGVENPISDPDRAKPTDV